MTYQCILSLIKQCFLQYYCTVFLNHSFATHINFITVSPSGMPHSWWMGRNMCLEMGGGGSMINLFGVHLHQPWSVSLSFIFYLMFRFALLFPLKKTPNPTPTLKSLFNYWLLMESNYIKIYGFWSLYLCSRGQLQTWALIYSRSHDEGNILANVLE